MSLGPELIPQQLHSKICLLLYTDPGSGALLFQLLGASGLMVTFYFTRVRDSIKKLFGVKTDRHQTDEPQP
jgi:hypothetical protein